MSGIPQSEGGVGGDGKGALIAEFNAGARCGQHRVLAFFCVGWVVASAAETEE